MPTMPPGTSRKPPRAGRYPLEKIPAANPRHSFPPPPAHFSISFNPRINDTQAAKSYIALPPRTADFGAVPAAIPWQQDNTCQKALACQWLRLGVWFAGTHREACSRPSAYRRVVQIRAATKVENEHGIVR